MTGPFLPQTIAVLTVSDSRTLDEDRSGTYLVEALERAGHRLVARELVPDDRYRIRAAIGVWIADPSVSVILMTGGTGPTGRDVSLAAVRPLFDKELDGFGEMFRRISATEIGTSAMLSDAAAGVANGTVVFVLPGSPGACRTAWGKIICAQLDRSTRPCSIADLMPRLSER